jgi:hypothetical protein
MKNVILQALTNGQGKLIPGKVKSVAPESMGDQMAVIHVLNLLSKTNLDVDFIEDYFKSLPLESLLTYNNVPEEIIVANKETVFNEIIHEVIAHADDELFCQFLSKDYNSELYEELIEKLFHVIENNKVSEESVGVFTTTINAFNTSVSKEFIFDHLSDYGYLLLTSALKRGDFTKKQLLENLEEISLEEIVTWLWEYDNVDPDETEGPFTMENKLLLFDLLKSKAENRDSN